MQRVALWAAWLILVALPAAVLAQPALERPATSQVKAGQGVNSSPGKSEEKSALAPAAAVPAAGAGRAGNPQPRAVTELKSVWEESGPKHRYKITLPAPGGGDLGSVKFGATPNRGKTMFAIPW